ncbi:MAG TPA: alpha/beta hydrolase [Gemmatimonadaceae bacterium]|nr:alpha/beta hydrolase [Gemmatimonadaceae bacterium]
MLIVPAFAALALTCDAQQSTASLAANVVSAGVTSARHGTGAANTTIVLIHGAWADGTGWQDIIPILQREGYRVIAVQNPLASLAGDVATTKRVIDRETAKGRTVVAVAHSYGGEVMSGAAAGNPDVKALVYIAALAPDAGERGDAFFPQFPTEIFSAFEPPDAAGFIYLSADKYRAFFAGDLPESQTRVMQASQKPLNGAIFGQSNTAAAWRTIPSWFIVAQEDRVINPDLERFYAKRMNARTTEMKASHVVFISRPNEVAKIILEAAATAGMVSTTGR